MGKALYNSFTDYLCEHMRFTDSVDANFVKYPVPVRPLLAYYWMGPKQVPGIPNSERGIFTPGN